MKQKILISIFFLVITLLVVGCNGNDSKEQNFTSDDKNVNTSKDNGINSDQPEKTTVSLMINWGEDTLESYYNQFIKEALSHINLTYSQASDQSDIEENFANGIVPDLVMGSNFEMYKELDLTRDQTSLIEHNGLELDRLDPYIIESLRNASPEGELLALPLFRPDGEAFLNDSII